KDPLFAPITFEWDLDNRRARVEVADTVHARSEPIRNPVTDAEHHMTTVLPQGWVFHEAENVAGFAKGTGPIRFDLNRRHSSLAHVTWARRGSCTATASTSRSSAGRDRAGRRDGRAGGHAAPRPAGPA